MEKPSHSIYRQSAVLPYRIRGGEIEVLVITSHKGTHWVLPKGIVEPDMTAPASAAKEALEEAGIEGQVADRSIGRYKHKKWGGVCDVEVFPMTVTTELDDWLERATRRREWVPLAEAARRLERHGVSEIIERLPDIVEPGKKND